MEYIKADQAQLRGWSMRMHVAPANSTTKYKYPVTVIDGFGYTPATVDALDEIDIDFTVVDSLPIVAEI